MVVLAPLSVWWVSRETVGVGVTPWWTTWWWWCGWRWWLWCEVCFATSSFICHSSLLEGLFRLLLPPLPFRPAAPTAFSRAAELAVKLAPVKIHKIIPIIHYINIIWYSMLYLEQKLLEVNYNLDDWRMILDFPIAFLIAAFVAVYSNWWLVSV